MRDWMRLTIVASCIEDRSSKVVPARLKMPGPMLPNE